MVSPAVADKIKKDDVFRRMLEKWALVKFLQLVFGDISLPFALTRYGSENSEERIAYGFRKYGFGNGSIRVGKLNTYNYFSKSDRHTNLPAYSYADDYDKTLTEEELQQLHKDLT